MMNTITDPLNPVFKNRQGVKLPDETVRKMLELYPTMSTIAVAEEFGVSKRSVEKYAKMYGVVKDADYMRLVRVIAGKKGGKCQAESMKRRGIVRKTTFRKGFNVRAGMSEEQKAAFNKKVSESLRRTRRKDLARIHFGLEQKTKWKLVREPIHKQQLRYRLKKKGYVIDEEQHVAYYNESTQRSERMESRKQSWYEFRQEKIEDEQ